ncbi:MAG: hypothetical protein NWP84_06315, partial [Cyanobium sp. MAG_04]|nr:hypothetical protein [Cyanobium sp. MAG_04]
MLARCKTAALQGLEARPVLVEVDLAPGLPGLQLVGLADTINVNSDLTTAGSGSVTLTADRNIVMNGGSSITTQDGA